MSRKKTGIRKLPSGSFEATVCLPGSRNKRRKRFPRELDATNWRIRTLAELQAGGRTGAGRPPLLSKALAEYEEWAEGRKEATAAWVRWCSTRIRAADYLEKRIDKLTTKDAERWRRELQDEGLAPSTVAHYLGHLRRLLNLQVEWGALPASPLAGWRPGTAKSARVRYLSTEEEAALLGAASASLGAAIRFSLATGARKGEMLALTWGMVDEEARVATIPAGMSKSGRDRLLYLNGDALAAMGTAGEPGDKVFPAKRGGKWWRLDKGFRATRSAAVKGDKEKGRPACPSLADFRWHDLRHTFASRLVMGGTDLYVVKELLGHSDLAMTQRYAHLSPGRLAEAVQKLSAVDFAVKDSQESRPQ